MRCTKSEGEKQMNSTGFHSPQESTRVLAMSIDFAPRAKTSAEAVLARLTAPEAVAAAP
jgi:formate-dependent nitrite reductase cytochrome c552 subunit